MKYRPKNCMSCGGKKMQQGGIDLSSYYNNPALYSQPPQEDGTEPAQQNSVQDMISKGILDTPNGYGSSEEWYAAMSGQQRQRHPINKQNLGIALRAGTTGLSWLSGIMERGRQNQYDYQQQTTLGQLNPIPSSNFQPNPYNLYSRYGGKLSKYQSGGPVDPVALAAANMEAKRFAKSRGHVLAEDVHVDHIPQYLDAQTGKPFVPTPTRPLAYNVPNDIQASDIQSAGNQFWYTDPRTGDVVDVDPSVVNLPRFRKPPATVAADLASRASSVGSFAGLKKGGWIQKATANMRTDHPCTGSKFGGPDCRPGTRRYALAKTFRKMAKNR